MFNHASIFFFCLQDVYLISCNSVISVSGFKDLAKPGNIVAETMFLVMFPGVAELGNISFGRKICVREAKMFLTPDKNIFCLMSSKICYRNTCFPARLNWETFASATMFPQRCFLV